ncbi:unnamed protein product [Closterium sp. Yama58-4]|nr:unnamed protein product [Closterium sp. Yama58-4]
MPPPCLFLLSLIHVPSPPSPSEEGPVIDLLRFIYTGDMAEGSSDPQDIIKMYLVADKFGVASYMKICLERLVNLPMTVPTARLFLSLPDSMHSHRGVAQLLEASRGILVAHFRDLERVHKGEEFLELPREAVRLAEHVRFPLMTGDDLEHVVLCPTIEYLCPLLIPPHYTTHHCRQAAVRLAEHVRFPLMTGDDLEDVVLKAPEMLDIHLHLENSHGVQPEIHVTPKAQAWLIRNLIPHWGGDDGTETLDIHLHLENSHGVQPEIQGFSSPPSLLPSPPHFLQPLPSHSPSTPPLPFPPTPLLFVPLLSHVSFIFYAKRWLEASYFYAKRWPEGQFNYLRDRVTKGFGHKASNWGYSKISSPLPSPPLFLH